MESELQCLPVGLVHCDPTPAELRALEDDLDWRENHDKPGKLPWLLCGLAWLVCLILLALWTWAGMPRIARDV